VNVDRTSLRVGENVAPGLCVLILDWLEPSFTHRLLERGLMTSLDQDVQVSVGSGLMPQASASTGGSR